MKSYLKFLSRNKLYTAIEAVGLIVSLAFVIVIGFSVWDQVMIAKKVPGEQNLYLLGPQKDLFFMEYRDKETLASIPEILEMASFQKTELTVQGGEEFRQMPVLIADSNLLEMLRIGVRSGSVDPLRHGQGVALTASAAARMFPDKDPVGQSLTIGAEGFENYGEHIKEAAEIVAVIDAPDHSILDDFDVFCPLEGNLFAPKTIREANIRENGYGRIVNTFATLVEGVELEAFSEKYVSQVGDTIDRDAKEGLMATDYRELYFSTQISIGGLKRGNRLYLFIMLILGLVLLLSAVLNYVNLSSAISGSRAKEMATRRLLGDSKQRVFWRIMLETLLFTLVCYVVSVLFASAITPYLNSLRPADVPVAFRVAPTFGFWVLSIAFILLVSLVSGLVPAVLLSSYKPVDVISGNIRRRRKMGFNKVCIIIQSLLALVLICLSITLHAQLRHLETLDLGVDPQENLFYYHPNWFYSSDIQVVGDKLSNLPQIKRIGYASGIPAHVGTMSSGPRKSMLNLISCDTLAFKMLGFRIREPYSEVKPGTIWITDELRNFSGVGLDSLEVSLVLPYNSGRVSEIGGVIEDFRKLAVNADDLMSGRDIQQFRAVEIPFDDTIKGILMETGPDHDAFRQEFNRVVTEHYRSTIGVPDLTTSNSNLCGYLDEIIAADYASLHRFVQIITLVGLIAVFLAMLGLVAMSAWFAGQNAKEIAIRKVFGSDERSETLRSVRSYMVLTLVAAAIGIPVSIVLIRRFLENYPERISGYWWIFALALAISLVISFVSVLWQTVKAAKTNPAIELKKE